MDKLYRAKLTLVRVEPYVDQYNNERERDVEIAGFTVTGNTASDAMFQIHEHAGNLYDWHDQQDRGEVDEAVNLPADHPLAKALSGLSVKLFGQDAKPLGPIRHVGTVSTAEQPAEPATDGEHGPYCMKRTPFGWCYRSPDHAGDCDPVPVDQLPDSADDEDRENNALLNAEADQRDQVTAENRCAYCSEAISLVGRHWYHDTPHDGHPRDGHDATPANLTAPTEVTQ